ncbi:hypothetical protein [Sphingobium sp. Z007]|uniref:hypothetical protein n=1 Tax=Sphingobium sp. Z007 TaxID=627495 RepID=UPI00278BB15D|nr:hypothetical protein [Sphingobium sp. Z007]
MRAQLAALVEARAARRRARIVAALEAAGVAAVVEGDAVRASAPGLAGRWWRDLRVRDAGRDGI